MTERGRVASSPLEQPTPPPPAASIKGGADGLRIVARSEDPLAVAEALRAQLEARRGRFFEGESISLELASESVNGEIVAAVCALLAEHGIRLVSVATEWSTAAGRDRRRAAPREDLSPDPDGALLVARTLRSGQEVSSAGAIVVIGDVNPGARVLAGGDVVVWGRLRGVVEAGLADEDAVVCALELAPTQLRIGTSVARAPDQVRPDAGPEVARRAGEAILVEPWSTTH